MCISTYDNFCFLVSSAGDYFLLIYNLCWKLKKKTVSQNAKYFIKWKLKEIIIYFFI